MSKKIYIDYASENYYTSKEEVKTIFREEGDYTSFDIFLSYNYDIEEVFNFDERDRERVKEEYEEAINEEFEDWVNKYMTIIDIEVEFKEK